ncbi:DUF2029 domain-containing protein [Actinobacteria bacterium YIM 96077]|uniref:DUF2029 domain-containing protein n=1 Tax=Phytoactinopolyspora halophila TaxID=1981511 RepID=A0A329QP41_9ACTN|nr:glycosyltransferase 87 family protein [Phytoactinopolyspora halophila]AYY15090.1 DUF2029 domain-containing protein [Actinobacteria bacterium YIM 96077]RAW14147.1 hypothetical protein DPM12_10795 [Phytoactinopolyspora halophila]
MNAHPIWPSRDDPTVAAASEWIGGPAGRHATVGSRWWNPLRIMLAVACTVFALGVLLDEPCHDASWERRDDSTLWTSLCYSDVPFLYRERGFSDGDLPYWDTALEYPVLTGVVMQGSAIAARAVQSFVDSEPADPAVAESVRFYEVTTLLVGLSALVVVAATALTVPQRPWDAMLVAASPIMLLSATINWDLLAVAAASVAILAWTRERPGWAGILIGVGAAVKLYPVLLLGPLVLVALRAPGRLRELRKVGVCGGVAVATWSLINAPFALWARDGWLTFFEFNAAREADFGSIWYARQLLAPELLPGDVDRLALGAALVLLGAIILLAMLAPRPPRLAQLAFLAVAAFVLINKVWSPQYSLWLLPLAALAIPRWRELLIWQAAEAIYVVSVWFYLSGFFADHMISDEVYAWSIVLRAVVLIWLCSMVVRDMFAPDRDPVRNTNMPPSPVPDRLEHAGASAPTGAGERHRSA